MSESQNPFEYADDPAAIADHNSSAGGEPLVVVLPAGLRGKQKLLAEYDRQLSLPDYFGWNWDALDECLRDLSWLPVDRPIVLAHAGLPFHGHVRRRGKYLAILADAVRFWEARQPGRLRVVFPQKSAAKVAKITVLEEPPT